MPASYWPRRAGRAESEREVEAGHEAAQINNRAGASRHLDLDDFTPVIDSDGYTAGDRLVGQRVRATVRSTDLLGRPGGDEFVDALRTWVCTTR